MENKPTIREEFTTKFPDPMTKKYGEGFKLYCDFCNSKGREEQLVWWLNKIKEVVGSVGVDVKNEYTAGQMDERQRILKEFGIIK